MPLTTIDSFNTRVHQLHHQVVRDLAWCCFSAPMMRELPGSNATIFPLNNDQLWPWLNALDQQPDALLAHITAVKSTRLGIYYETLWHFYFSQHPEWELLQHNLQVERNSITLGAFDFLCRRNGEYWHIETAVKFYLCNATSAEDARNWHHWIGPASHDRLDVKLARMRQHQLPLHQTMEARTQLQMLYPEAGEWKSGLCVQGYLFSPAFADYSPKFCNTNHGKGYWWRLQDFLQYQREYNQMEWIILERHRWLAPVQISDEEQATSTDFFAQLQLQVGEMKRPLLLAALKKNNDMDNYWQEKWRGFVVPDHWPDKNII